MARDVLESYPIAITGYEGGLYAVGCARMSNDGECGGAPVAWTSFDGSAWERSRLDLSGGWSPLDVTAADPVLVLVGSTDWGTGSPAAAASSDGASWTESTIGDVGALDTVLPLDDGTLVAAGWSRDADGTDHGLVARSDDAGGSWSEIVTAPDESQFHAIDPSIDIAVGCAGSLYCWDGTPAAWALGTAQGSERVPATPRPSGATA